MAMTEARKRANKKWNDANLNDRYERIQILVAKGKREEIKRFAQENGESVNGFICRLIDAELEKHNIE